MCCKVGVISILTEGDDCAKVDALVVSDNLRGMIYRLGLMLYVNLAVL